jgi:hypothetical protein
MEYLLIQTLKCYMNFDGVNDKCDTSLLSGTV